MNRTFGIRFDHNTIHVVVTEKDQHGAISFIDACTRKVPLTPKERISFETVKENEDTKDRHQRNSARRNHQRYLLRRRQLMTLLKEQGFIDELTPLTDSVVEHDFCTWERRAAAVNEKVSLEDLARIFLMMNKHRGYKASKKISSKDEGSVIDSTEHSMLMNKMGMTPGQYLRYLNENGEKTSVSFYPSELKAELVMFISSQRVFHPEIITDEIADEALKCNETSVSRLMNISKSENKKIEKDDIINARAQAADGEKVEVEMLAPVISTIIRQISKSSEYLGLISERSKDLYLNDMTPAEWMWERMKKEGNAFSVKNNVFFRIDYQNEFDKIWATQKEYHPVLTDELYKEIRDYILFYQRPLKSAKSSYCPFESWKVVNDKGTQNRGSRTAPKSSPLYQEYRMYHDLNNVCYNRKDEKTKYSLDRQMLEKIAAVLRKQDTMTDKALLKLIGLNSKEYELNFKELKGNSTYSAIYKALTKEASARGLNSAEKLLEVTGADRTLLDYDWSLSKEEYERQSFVRLWILIDSYEGDNSATGMDTLRRQIKERFGTDDDTTYALSMISFEDGHGSLSHKAMKKLLPHLIEGTGYYDACIAVGYNVSETHGSGKLIKSLPIIKKGEMFNPIAEKIINQLINVINQLIAQYGNPNDVVVEMPRELNASKMIREEMLKRIKQREAENKKFTKEITDITGNPNVTSSQLLRYRLYKELEKNGYRTLYSNRKIEPYMVFDAKLIHKEHIIPQSVIFDDNFVNYTLEFADVDKDKADMTARDYVLSKYGQKGLEDYIERVENLYNKKAISWAKRNYLLMERGEVPNNILDRQTPARQYAMKQLAKMLALISEKVIYTTPSVTSALKKDWGLANIITDINAEDYSDYGRVKFKTASDGRTYPEITVRTYNAKTNQWVEKKWSPSMDPRSGIVDAAVVACTTASHINLLNNLYVSKVKDSNFWMLRNRLTTFVDGKRLFKFPNTNGDIKEQITGLVRNTMVSIKSSERLTSSKINFIKAGKSKKDIKTQKTLVPRGELHGANKYSLKVVYKDCDMALGPKFGYEQIMTVIDERIKEVLINRLSQYNGDNKKAFSKTELRKNPIVPAIPETIRCRIGQEGFAIRKNIDNINVSKIISDDIRNAYEERIRLRGGLKAATEDLKSNPLIVNGQIVKRAQIMESLNNIVSLRYKRDHNGEYVKDKNGERIPCDWVSTSNNHHLNVYRTETGDLSLRLMTFIESIDLVNKGLDPYDKEFNADKGWKYLYHLCKADMVVFPDIEEGFLPEKMSIDELNASPHTTKNLFFVQKMSKSEYVFRHHTDNNVDMDAELKNFKLKKLNKAEHFIGLVKVHINHIGKIDKKY